MNLNQLLELYHKQAVKKSRSFILDNNIRGYVTYIVTNVSNKAPIRFLMSCLLAKIYNPAVDVRKPYTEIGGIDSFSGRKYDETYIQPYILKYNLPCNSTTAFLTPAFRNINKVLDTTTKIEGRPKELYSYLIDLLDLLNKNVEAPENVLKEIIRLLIKNKTESDGRIGQLLGELKISKDISLMSSEDIINLLEQHLKSKNSSRLPVLLVNAAYLSVQDRILEKPLPLNAHNAADSQTGSIGDIEITLAVDSKVVTCYEMKDKKVIKSDLDQAIIKVKKSKYDIDNYIFITTDLIEREVLEYAISLYEKTGIEFVILDCIGFIRYFLHFFHRSRIDFLNIYQDLVLSQPDSSVSLALKESFLLLRKVAEQNEQ